MIKKRVILVFLFVTLMSNSQKKAGLQLVRSEFQNIKSEEDIEKVLAFNSEEVSLEEMEIIEAYKASATCMRAEFVFAPKNKLKYFNEGKKQLEALIVSGIDVEKIYLRLLLQLSIPRILNYHENIESDVAYLDKALAKAPIELSYKYVMIKNLVSAARKEELKDFILQIEVVDKG